MEAKMNYDTQIQMTPEIRAQEAIYVAVRGAIDILKDPISLTLALNTALQAALDEVAQRKVEVRAVAAEVAKGVKLAEAILRVSSRPVHRPIVMAVTNAMNSDGPLNQMNNLLDTVVGALIHISDDVVRGVRSDCWKDGTGGGQFLV